MTDVQTARMTRNTFQSFDGASLSYQIEGEGRAVVMLHGFLSSAQFNFIAPGITAAIVAAGFQALMLDFRAHGQSAAPEDAGAYPPDVLALDAAAFVAHLGLSDYDLVGYSLGGRTAARMLVRGARPRRCVIGGMGESGVIGLAKRVAYFEDLIVNGERAQAPDAAKTVAAMIAQSGLNPRAVLHALRSQTPTPPEALAEIETPILVVSGARDDDNGSAEALAALFPNARALRTPGNHLSAVGKPELAAAIVSFLRA